MTMTTIMGTITTTTTDTTMTTDTDTTMTTITTTEAAAAMIVRPMTTVNTSWFTIMLLTHTKRISPAIRTLAAARPAILMKNTVISAGKAWRTANAVCRTLTT